MLSKLMKYEWKSTCKGCGVLLFFILVMTVLGCVSFRTPMWTGGGDGARTVGWIDIVGIFSLIAYVFSLIGTVWGAIIYLGVHYYRGLYSDQGYLTHTLPVSAHQLLISRIISGGLWLLLILCGVILSCAGLILSLAGAAVQLQAGQSVWEALWQGRNEFLEAMDKIFSLMGITSRGYFLVSVISVIIGSFTAVMSLLGALTLGQLFPKHKVLMSIVCYGALGIVQQIAGIAVQMPFMVSSAVRTVRTPQSVSVNMNVLPNVIITLIINVVVAVALYFVSHYILTKKLNLD